MTRRIPVLVPRRSGRMSLSKASRGPLQLGTVKLCLMLTACLAACSTGPSDSGRDVVFDFVEYLPLAEVNQEVKLITFGMPQARSHFVSGWSRDATPGKERYVWSTGRKSVLSFWLRSTRDLPIRLRCEPFGFGGGPQQHMSIAVNGFRVTEIAMKPGMVDYEISLLERTLRPGGNLLTFQFAYAWAPIAVSPISPDRRIFSARWTEIEFLDASSDTVRTARDRLHLPAGSRLDYYLNLRPSNYVEVGRLRRRGDARIHLEVTIDGEALSEPAKIDVSADENGRLIPVPVSTPQKGRISFRAVAAPDEGLRPGTLIVEDLTLTAEPRGDAVDTSDSSDSSDSSDAVDDSRRFNVVVYLIDTLRSDHLGCYGYDKPTSPNIDAFAAEAAVFEHTIAQASYTRASVPSLLTGTGPRTHGVLLARNQLPDTIQNVAEILSRRGYDTAAFITNPVVDKSGIERGVDQFKLEAEPTVLKNALQWIDDRDSGAPFYLYLHTMEPHAPYAPPTSSKPGLPQGFDNPR